MDWLNSSATPSSVDLDVTEEEAMKSDSLMHRAVGRLVTLVRALQHELREPNYLYAGGRIHRQALLVRNAQIEQLQNELKQLKKDNVELISKLAAADGALAMAQGRPQEIKD